MKEYILLAFIAAVGLSGLFTIHYEVQTLDDRDLYFDAQVLSSLSVKKPKTVKIQSQLLIEQDSIWPQIALEISNFDPSSVYYLDTGDNQRIRVSTPTHVFTYQESGSVLLKLLKDNILVDAIELPIGVDKHANAKLVSF